MNSSLQTSLELTRLLVRQGDLHKARMRAEDAMKDALILGDRESWLEGTRIFFQCCQELDELGAAHGAMEKVLDFLVGSLDSHLQAQAEVLVGSWLLAQGKMEEAQDYVQSAMNKATDNQDLMTLARSLSISSYALSQHEGTYKQALQQLEKLEIILDKIDAPEIRLTASIFKGYLYDAKKQPELALPQLWQCYEYAKNHGFVLHISSLIAQIARIHLNLNQMPEYNLYSDLARRGLDRNKTPRLYKMIAQVCPILNEMKPPSVDFFIDERARFVKEKNKGRIDFKNQHILFELALLFIKNPGVRYLKDDLARAIWNQPYSPDLHDNLIYVSIKRLRTLLEPDLESPQYILRDRKGYYFNPQSLVQFKHAEEMTP